MLKGNHRSHTNGLPTWVIYINGKGVCKSCSVRPSNKPKINCESIKHSDYYKHAKEDNKRTYEKLKTDILLHYGGICACCGFDDINKKLYGDSFLKIDHINGGGMIQQRELGGSIKFYYWLKKNDYPEGYRVLCGGCNNSMPPGALRCILHPEGT